ncbi:unnamed protein product, partial [Mycena citricolor]
FAVFLTIMPPPDSDKAPKPRNLRDYHRPPRIKLGAVGSRIPALSAESKRCLRNLSAYKAPPERIPFPRTRCAAVLVALFVGRRGDLHVLLSRRSSTLRSYAGDTALPGGKVDPDDGSLEDAAVSDPSLRRIRKPQSRSAGRHLRRYACSGMMKGRFLNVCPCMCQIGLPADKLKVPLLCILSPVVASNYLVVTPVVVLILDNTLRPILNTAEVASLFSHPLASFLSSSPPFSTEPELVEVPYHTTSDWRYPGPNGQMYFSRGHRFLTGREAGGIKPVFGLTAAILIDAACIAHRRVPEFELTHPEGMTREARLAWIVYSQPAFRTAYEVEGIEVDWEQIRRLAGVVDDRGDIDRKGDEKKDTLSKQRRRIPKNKSKL